MKNRIELVSTLIQPGDTVIELGVARGIFSKEILENCECGILYSVDMWAGDRGHNDCEQAWAAKTLEPFGARSKIIKSKFEDIVDTFKDEFFDFIYIDGYAHTGQDDGKTLNDWWAKVKPGGIFAGHDYAPRWQPTITRVNAFVKEHELDLFLTDEIAQGEFKSWYVIKPS